MRERRNPHNAAAPEMYEALVCVLERIGKKSMRVVDMVRDAIAKAEGRPAPPVAPEPRPYDDVIRSGQRQEMD